MHQKRPAPKDPKQFTLREAYETYILPDHRQIVSNATLKSYAGTLNKWERLMTDNPPVGEIDNQTLVHFRDACIADGNSPATFNSEWRNIKVILRRLAPQQYRNPQGEGILERFPYVRMLPVERKLPRIATFEELSALYDAFDQAVYPVCDVPSSDWWKAFLVVAYNCCARISDMISMRMEHIDLKDRMIKFRAKKTGKWQMLPLNDVTLAHISRIWSKRERLFPGASDKGGKEHLKEWHRLQDLAGIDPHFGFHDLRRTGGTKYDSVDRGIAKWILGHSLKAVTDVSYINPTEDIKRAAKQLPQPEAFLRILENWEGVKNPEEKNQWQSSALRPKRGDWQFFKNSAKYRGQEIRFHEARRLLSGNETGRRYTGMDSRPLNVLRALVQSGRPLDYDGLRRVVWWDRPKTSKTIIKQTVHHLRETLKRDLDLPPGWEPIKHDKKNGWVLRMP